MGWDILKLDGTPELASPAEMINRTIDAAAGSNIALTVEMVNELIRTGRNNRVKHMRIKIDKSLKSRIGLFTKYVNIGIAGVYSDYLELEVIYN